MTILNIFLLLGGLGMFLYGMKIMGDNLERCAGGRLEKILETLTSNKYKGILLGVFVTAVIQSSGAVTVMLVGFVNSGIMQFEQTIGVIMGSGIGTTVTAWILSLSGIGGSSLILQVLKPENFSPLLIFFGAVMSLFFHKDKIKNVGRIIMGFGLLMYGMAVMTESMSPLSESETFSNILTVFNNPVFGVIAGIVITVILQSSSASVGVLQALSVTGAISFNTAMPILIGENIGACSTALISSVNANRQAKQTALVQLYYRLITSAVIIVAYCILNAIFKFSFADATVNTFRIAVMHTVFNVISMIIMLPFTNKLIALGELTVKESASENDENVEAVRIDDRLLKTPDIAIEQCKNAIHKMSELAMKNVSLCADLLNEFDEKKYETVSKNETMIDSYQDALATALSKISARKSNAQTSRSASLFLHAISDVERIGDHALNIADSAKTMNGDKLSFSEITKKELEVVRRLMENTMSAAFSAFKFNNTDLAVRVEPMEEIMDQLSMELKNRAVSRIQNNEYAVEEGIVYLDVLNDFERISDHCSNLGLYIIQSQSNSYALHAYSDNMKKDDRIIFNKYYYELKNKYLLPEWEDAESSIVEKTLV